MFKKLLREYIKMVQEGVSTNGFALLKKSNTLIVWDPPALETLIADIVPKLQTKNIDKLAFQLFRDDIPAQWIIGYISASESAPGRAWDGWEIESVAARKKFGPLMYDLAMSVWKRIYADRKSVSPDAANIWNFYLKNRTDVKKLPFDDINDPQTQPKTDDATLHPGKDALNYAYQGAKIDSAGMEEAHEVGVQTIIDLLDDHGIGAFEKDIKKLIHMGGRSYFYLRYKG